ncbi:MAG: hypothetical protein JWQ76_3474, partial [Ramlibacter sp.]|nr:hypothetical protein [Ramlibacter sp.]
MLRNLSVIIKLNLLLGLVFGILLALCGYALHLQGHAQAQAQSELQVLVLQARAGGGGDKLDAWAGQQAGQLA